MNIERLQEVIRVLERPLPKGGSTPTKFSLDHWRCGTKACAIGHAATRSKLLRNAGLVLQRSIWEGSSVPKFGTDSGWGAIEKCFDISFNEAYYLFASESYKRGNRRQVTTRIKEFIKQGAAKNGTTK